MIRLALEPYQLAFPPTRDASGERSERRGAVLTLRDSRGRSGAGELAPLPGRSRESLDACHTALQAFDTSRLRVSELAGAGWLDAVRRASALLPAELAAARHALETALLDLCGALQDAPGPALLAGALGFMERPSRLPVAALIDAVDLDEARSRAELAAAQGIGTAKLKIAGSETNEAILERVRRVGALLCLRVDANRSLSPAQSAALAPELAAHGVEFLEEPQAFSRLSAPAPLPLAVDESLLDADFSLTGARERGVLVLVLKPMLLGFLAALDHAQSASAAGLTVVLSHSFDGPRAMAAARCLALALGPRRYADGLASHAALSAWPEPVPVLVSAPFLEGWTSPGLGVS